MVTKKLVNLYTAKYFHACEKKISLLPPQLQRCSLLLFLNYALLTSLTHKFSPSQTFTKGSLNTTAV